MRVLLITEVLNPPYDEGIKKTVFNVYEYLRANYDLDVITRNGFLDDRISSVNSNVLFLDSKIRSQIKKNRYDVLIYFPFASATFASYIRMFLFRCYSSSRAKKILIALQPKKISSWQELLIKWFLKPKFGLTPSPLLKEKWDQMKVKSSLFPLMTNLEDFKPLFDKKKTHTLRQKYGLSEQDFVISHMGHLNDGRNLKSLLPLQKQGVQVVIVGSSSTPADSLGPESLKAELENAGIKIIDKYIANIAEVYQLSDLYIFPVISKTGSIGMPLSIMEARACGIPVLTTDFGSLKHYLQDDNNGIVYSDPENFETGADFIRNNMHISYSVTRVTKLNDDFFSILDKAINN